MKVKTGGRKKGVLNKSTTSLLEKAKELGCDPFEILLRFAKGDWQGLGYDNECYHMETASGATKLGFVITPNMRMTASTEACKYLHSQKKAIELSGNVSTEVMEAAEKVGSMTTAEKIAILKDELKALKDEE